MLSRKKIVTTVIMFLLLSVLSWFSRTTGSGYGSWEVAAAAVT